jgi:hypothetical protein
MKQLTESQRKILINQAHKLIDKIEKQLKQLIEAIKNK